MSIQVPEARADRGQHIRITLHTNRYAVDVDAPARAPVGEWLHHVVATLHETGFAADFSGPLTTSAGRPLALDVPLAGQGVVSGDRLWFTVPPERPRVSAPRDAGLPSGRTGTSPAGPKGVVPALIAAGVLLSVVAFGASRGSFADVPAVLAAVCLHAWALLMARSSAWKPGRPGRHPRRPSRDVPSLPVVGWAAVASAAILTLLHAPGPAAGTALAALVVLLDAAALVIAKVLGPASAGALLVLLAPLGGAAGAMHLAPRSFGIGLLALGAAWTAAMVTSHRLGLWISHITEAVGASGTAGAETAARTDSTTRMLDRLSHSETRLVDRARTVQAAVAAASFAGLVACVLIDGVALPYDVAFWACALAAAALLPLSGTFPGRSAIGGLALLLLLSLLAANVTLPLASSLVLAAFALLAAALVLIGHAFVPSRWAVVTCLRLRPLVHIAVFATLVMELGGWTWAWSIGYELAQGWF
ncbi:EsaB/YukD family protein [Streptomyces sp. NPDC051776]|uniref:EsaB/YukD family protein n=1 Tax=Streptomyces sp. NPDC051776 TaxID=3155414 RepID=UPI003437A00E